MGFRNKKHQQWFLVCALVACLSAPSFAHHMAVVTHRDNPVQNLSSNELARILEGETKKWNDGQTITLILHKSSSDEDGTIQRICKKSSAQRKAFLLKHKDAIRWVNSDADVIEAVATTPGAVGLVEAHSINDRIAVIKIDGKLPLEGGYLPH